MICENFCLKKNEIKDYLTHLFKNDNSSGYMDEKVDHWLDSFENSTRSILLFLHYRYHIIMGIIKINEFPHHTAETDCVFTQIDSNIIYMYRGLLQHFYWNKGSYECLEMTCEHFCLKKN